MQVSPIASYSRMFHRPKKHYRGVAPEAAERRYVRDERDENAPRFVIYA